MDTFFGIHIASASLFGMSLPLVLAVILGGLIGLEREVHGHPAGLRTHILVCLGATLMTVVSVEVSRAVSGRSDPGRIAAQIVSGIGFLGAGAIIREGATVRGLTTAASIWTTAGVGIALGASPFLAQLAVITTAIVLFTLWTLDLVENWLNRHLHRQEILDVSVRDTKNASATVLTALAEHGVTVHGIDYESGKTAHIRHMLMRVRTPSEFDRNAFIRDLGDEEDVLGVTLH